MGEAQTMIEALSGEKAAALAALHEAHAAIAMMAAEFGKEGRGRAVVLVPAAARKGLDGVTEVRVEWNPPGGGGWSSRPGRIDAGPMRVVMVRGGAGG